MIKVKFLDNNNFLVKCSNKSNFNEYIKIITSKLLYCAKPNLSKTGGWIFHNSKLKEVESFFKDIKYENEYIPPVYHDMGKDMKLQPYDYQKEAIYYGLKQQKALMTLPCGAGKTVIGIGLYLEAINNNIIQGQGLIVVKASLKTQWKNEVSKFSDLSANIIQTYSDRCLNIKLKIKRLEKKLKKIGLNKKNLNKRKEIKEKIQSLENEANIYFKEQFSNGDLLIVNYETLTDEKVIKELKSKKIDCIICDEIHYAKTYSTKRSKALYKLNDAKIKIGATATPVTKDPTDIFGIYNFIKPELFESESKFNKQYIKYAGYGKIECFKNMDELRNKIKNNIFVKTKKEISDQLPKLKSIPIYFDLTEEQLNKNIKIMNDLEELKLQDFFIRKKCTSEKEVKMNIELQTIHGKIMALQTFAQELTDSPLLLSNSDSEYSKSYSSDLDKSKNPKLDICLEIIEQIIDSGEKVCIFSKFERMQSILTEAIIKQFKNKIKIAYINGSMPDKDRYKEAYNKFRDNDSYNILLCSDAGAEGLNLSNCKYLIEYDLATSFAIQTQRQGRLERADSVHNNVFVYQLIANDSWDILQEKIIKKKEGYDNNLIKNFAKNY